MENGTQSHKPFYKQIKFDNIFAFALIIALWKIISLVVSIDMVFPSPKLVIKSFISIVSSKGFALSLFYTSLRALSSFILSMILGSLCGFLCAISFHFDSLFNPILLTARATPVLAIILIALIWFPSGGVPIFSAFIMAFPVVCLDVKEGIKSVDTNLINMAKSFSIPEKEITLKLRLPSAAPHFLSAAKNSLGLSWKVVIAGEVLSQPKFAIGSGMQNARIMLETAEVFSWAICGIILCAISDAIFNYFTGKIKWITK